MNSSNSNKGYVSTRFEVSGRVQGVFFRKFTKAKAIELGLTGWCRNTTWDTVEGEFEHVVEEEERHCTQSTSSEGDGRSSKCKVKSLPRESVAEFRYWLCNIGSPHSRIDKCTGVVSGYFKINYPTTRTKRLVLPHPQCVCVEAG